MLSGLQIKASDSPFDIFKLFLSFFFWLLCCLAFKLLLLIAHLASSNLSCPFSFGYCVVWCYGLIAPLASSIVLFRVIVLAGLQIKASDSPFGIFKLFLSFFFWFFIFLRITASDIVLSFKSFGLASSNFFCPFFLVIVLSGLQITASDSPFGIFKPFLSFLFWLLCCLVFKLRLLIAPLASSNFSCPFSFGYCVIVNYGFW